MRRLSPSDKLRTLLGAKVGRLNHFKRTELAEILGVSTRTLRRIANVPDYQPSAKTLAKIKAPLDRENRNFRRFIQDKAVVATRVRVRGKVRTTYKYEKSPEFRLPKLSVQPIVVVYYAKERRSRTFAVVCELWSEREKIGYLISASKSGRFLSWTARVKVPVGVATSGDVESTEVNDGERPMHYMIGPFTLLPDHRTVKLIEKEISYHEDAGRKVVNISIVENLKGE
jgi:transcriptional regulator with XRE-family HTH domain